MIGDKIYSNNIRISIVPYKEGWYWSKIYHKMFYSKDIKNMIWEKEDVPIKVLQMTFKEAIEYIKSNPGKSKSERNALMRFDAPRFALKDYIEIDKWSRIIFVDLDLNHSPKINKLNKEELKKLYDGLDFALQDLMPNNYMYIEHSSSGVGIHCIFYFDCQPTKENHDKYCKYIYDTFRYKIDDYIKDFSHIFDPTIVGKEDAVFDGVYKRPYQKCFLTCIDYKLYNVNGYSDDIQVDIEDKIQEEEEKIQKKEELNGTFDIKYITKQKKYNTHYYDRLYILTALKKYVGDKEESRKLWYELCKDLTLYDNYTIQKFKNEFDINWPKIKADNGHLTVLKKYGFKIDDSNLHIHLKDDEYLIDKIEDIIKFSQNGINLLISPTGSGKTESWKEYFSSQKDNPFLLGITKPILIVEPMNSIIDSKYDKEVYSIITGSKKLDPKGIFDCFVTNYNHLIKYCLNGEYEIMKNVEDFFFQFSLVIIDESHIMLKDTFRSEVLVPFLQTLNKINKTKVIIQTATPLFEETVLNIKKTITIHKKDKQYCKIIYRQDTNKTFNITDITCLVNYYISNNKKVYVYWKNGSLTNMNLFRKLYPDTCTIYHKRNLSNKEMKNIDETHILDTELLISSVYFGVGNDLNNEIENAAVIIIGNNIWQEDIQAKGRWRKAKSIEVCIINLPNDEDFFKTTLNSTISLNDLIKKNENILSTIYNDKFNRDKSCIIQGISYDIKDKEYIFYLSRMKAVNEYSEQIKVKNDNFNKLGYDVRDTIKPLLINTDWTKELKEHKEEIKNIRNKQIKDMLEGKFEYDIINKDAKLEKLSRIIKKLYQKNLIQYINIKNIKVSKISIYDTFLSYYNKGILNKLDLAEIFSIIWTKDNIKGKKLSKEEQNRYLVSGYLIWLSYRNKNDNDELIKYNYFKKFSSKVDDFINLEDKLIDKIFSNQVYTDEYNAFLEEFLGYKINQDQNINKDNLIDYIINIQPNKDYLAKIFNKIQEYIKISDDSSLSGKIGGKISSPKKQVKDLKTGKIYDSKTDCAKDIKKSNAYISKYKNRFIPV